MYTNILPSHDHSLYHGGADRSLLAGIATLTLTLSLTLDGFLQGFPVVGCPCPCHFAGIVLHVKEHQSVDV